LHQSGMMQISKKVHQQTMISPGESRLQPKLSNLTTLASTSHTVQCAVASAPVYGSTLARHGILTNVPFTPVDHLVLTITNTPGNQFNAFRIDKWSSLECHRQTMEHKLKVNVF
jgi:hypothetical protein